MSDIQTGEEQAINARWHSQIARQISRRIVVEGELELTSPAHFGNGDSDGIELVLLKDAAKGVPLLPGPSIAGALRDYLWKREMGFRVERPDFRETDESLAAMLFGRALTDEQGIQSRVIVDDGIGTAPQLVQAREGVKIRGDKRIAEEQKLYTFQVWPAGTRFSLRFELLLVATDKPEQVDAMIAAFATALDALGEGQIPVGARKHRGYGAVQVDKWNVRDYDIHSTTGLLDWLESGGEPASDNNATSGESAMKLLGVTDNLVDVRRFVQVKGKFALRDSLLIRAGSDVVDMVHLHDSVSGQPILSGTSLTGALRARALKIANTLELSDAIELVDKIFGAFGEAKGNDKPHTTDIRSARSASRLVVKEAAIKEGEFIHVQNRVKIDRFTGGAFDTGLFAQQPVFAKDDTHVKLDLTLRFGEDDDDTSMSRQTGLLLMLVKDLWTGDLPLGGESSVGRGRLAGESVTITLKTAAEKNPEMVTITADGNGLNVDQPELLDGFVRVLVK